MGSKFGLAAILFAAVPVLAATGPPSLIVVAPRSPWTLRELEARHAALVSYDPDTGAAYVVATPDEQAALARAGFAFATVEPDAEAGLRRLQASRQLGAYHSYAETVAELDSLAAAFPDLCRLESLGQTGEGREILALKISDSPHQNDPSEPDVLIAGNHHAREFMSVEVPLHLARTLLSGYGTSPQITHLVNDREVWIVPLLNADGHVFQEDRAASDQWVPPGWRKNRRLNLDATVGVDPNRNYGFQWGYDEDGSSGDGADETYRGSAAFSEPETQAIRRLVERQRFVVSLSYHSFGKLLLYPWGYTRDVLADDQPVFAVLADSMVRGNGYRPGNAFFGTIYKTNGEMCDYLYGEINTRKPRSTFAFTVELNNQSEGFWPAESVIAPTCAAMLPLNLFALEAAGGVRGWLAPPRPLLTANQDPADRTRIDLHWTQPVDAENAVDHYEVFETAPAQAQTQSTARLARSGRAVFATGVRRPAGGRVAVRLAGKLTPLWDYAYVEARGPDGEWRALRGELTRDASPTGRNAGRGLTGALPPCIAWFETGAVTGEAFDLALRLDAAAGAPETAWLQAGLDLGATAGEVRRILDPNVHGTAYTVHADHPGLAGYGITAVDVQGQKTDSELLFFLIPTTGIALTDVRLVPDGRTAQLEWRGAEPGDRFEAWTWERVTGERSPVVIPGAGAVRAAVVTPASAGAGALRFELAPGSWWIALQVQSAGDSRWYGPFSFAAATDFGFVPGANPVRGAARIRYQLAHAGPATVEICSVDGRCVRRWTPPGSGAGAHELEWDGRDARGERVPAGVYLLRLQQGGRAAARRIVKLN